MTPLAEILVRRIAATGPISIADYMANCLLHPQHGYYATREPFGSKGDFITAPEISQMFGELVGLCLAQCWIDQGQPRRFILAEAGPGRGTLMADILRATRAVAGFRTAADVHLIEASQRLQAIQRETLHGEKVTWTDNLNSLPDAPLFLVANEFFDALPVRQFTRDKNGWREHQIGLDKGELAMGLTDPAPIEALEHWLSDTVPGEIVELCPSAVAIMTEISERVAKHGGVALIIDYGNWHSLGDTLQAVKDHKSDGVLRNPGEADLTAHVDFEALARATSGVAITRMVSQGVFLEQLGITVRAQTLAKNLNGAALKLHISAHRRLTHPDEMGTLFKVIAVHKTGSQTPPGFVP